MNEMDGACSTYGERRGTYWVLVGRTDEKSHLEDPGLDGRIVIKLVFQKWDGEPCIGFIRLRMGTGGGLF
jgi:hypothetical protein